MSTEDCLTCGTVEVAYYRSANGVVIHRETCTRRGATSVPWHYASRVLDNSHHAVLLEVAAVPWLRACSYCMTAELLTCSGCGTTYDATDPDHAGVCVHGNLCRPCWAACDRGRSCRDGCHERGQR